MINIGQRIKILREILKIDQKRFAASIDEKYPNLSSMENGKSTPPIDVIKKIIDLYKISPDYFFKDNLVIFIENGEFRIDSNIYSDKLRIEEELLKQKSDLQECQNEIQLYKRTLDTIILNEKSGKYNSKKKAV